MNGRKRPAWNDDAAGRSRVETLKKSSPRSISPAISSQDSVRTQAAASSMPRGIPIHQLADAQRSRGNPRASH